MSIKVNESGFTNPADGAGNVHVGEEQNAALDTSIVSVTLGNRITDAPTQSVVIGNGAGAAKGNDANLNVGTVVIGDSAQVTLNANQDANNVILIGSQTANEGKSKVIAIGESAAPPANIAGNVVVHALGNNFGPAAQNEAFFDVLAIAIGEATNTPIVTTKAIVLNALANAYRARVEHIAGDKNGGKVYLSGESSGTEAKIGVLGAQPHTQIQLPPAATDETTERALVNAMRDLLIAFGFGV